MVDVPYLGKLEKDSCDNWLISQPITVKVLGDKKCRFILDDYEQDENKEEYHQAIANFLSIDESILKQAQNDIYRYYQDIKALLDEDDIVKINNPSDVWHHIQLGDTPIVQRRPYGDKAVYISLESECDWEPEHGLQIIFKQGLFVSKIGEYDGHLSYADSYADPKLENVVYHSFSN
ncbi:DUF6985 domain-containing protein [Psychrobacter lutiphocae]|uniref:DUF6985 domain-containing protein n=1 Tax=Psychrobacter lutiphocae TaxID=540500 RepID=UPI0003609531|nr:hypothetical protein [Psychrobacter lutiphocae]